MLHDLCSPPSGLCAIFSRVTAEGVVLVVALPIILIVCARKRIMSESLAIMLLFASLIAWQQAFEVVPAVTDRTQMSIAANISCEALVHPVASSVPMRSPQRVHSLLAQRFAGKDVVEIGSGGGDGISCFARSAHSAVAIEQDAAGCKKLRDRQRAGALSFRVLCGSYASVAPDADVYTWWQGQQQLDLPNRAVLGHLAAMVRHGKVRKDAVAVLLFDHKAPGDMGDWRSLHRLADWSKRVVFDERASGGCSHRQSNAQGRLCHRAHGAFTVASIPLSRVNW
jgi:hypothetical protein